MTPTAVIVSLYSRVISPSSSRIVPHLIPMQQSPVSPSRPLAPPMKKQRAGGTPSAPPQRRLGPPIANNNNTSDERLDSAIAERQSRILQLQQRQAQQNAVLDQARTQLHKASLRDGGGRKPAAAAAVPTAMQPPKGSAIARVRHSDIFPSVPKLAPNATSKQQQQQQQQQQPSAVTSKSETLARRLDASFSSSLSGNKKSSSAPPRIARSKSAPPPPTRPPPPRPAAAPKNVSFPQPTAAIIMATTPGSPKAAAINSNNNATTTTTTPKQPPQQQPSGLINARDAGRTPFPTTTTTTSSSTALETPLSPTMTTMDNTPTTTTNTTNTTSKLHAGRTPFPSTRAVATTDSDFSSSSSTKMSPELRLHKEMTRLEHEKTSALQQVAQLQDQVTQLRKEQQQQQQQQQKTSSSSTQEHAEMMQALLRIADTQGETAALEWARQQQQQQQQQQRLIGDRAPQQKVGFWSPSSSRRTTTPKRPQQHSTPTPKRRPSTVKLSAEQEYQILVQAADHTAHEYQSPQATFMIRRPYGRDAAEKEERDLWLAVGQSSAQLYPQQADPTKAASTLEVVAHIHADQSVLVLYGDAQVRHCTTEQQQQQQQGDGNNNNNNNQWKDYGNADENNNELGSVLYIDSDANEKEYSLDEIFQGARAVREHYCSSFSCVAATLREKAVAAAAAPTRMSTGTHTKNVGVGTEDFLQPTVLPAAKKATKDTSTSTTTATDKSAAPKQQKKKKAPPPEEPGSVMGTFVSMFVNYVFNMIWLVLVGIPLRILSTTIVMLCATLLLATLWIYTASDMSYHGRLYNPPGIA